MAIHQMQENPPFLLDALYCEEEEEKWDDNEDQQHEENQLQGLGIGFGFEDDGNDDDDDEGKSENGKTPFVLLEQDLCWEDEDLTSLFSKEQTTHPNIMDILDSCLTLGRREAVVWILKVNSHYGFSALTAVLAVNYLDRFLSGLHFQKDKPWMIHLVAVTCLSLAAKVEETHVPLLLDLQVEDTKYVFEAKTIQRMELLLLSTLQWKMHPVTPLSFLDHIIRRLGLKTHLHWDFLRRSENLLLCLISDSRIASFLPSVLATATMMHVIDQIEPSNPIEYQNQLLGILKISKGNVNDCYKLILGLSKNSTNNHHKRKFDQIPGSPSGGIDSWTAVESSPAEPHLKKNRVLLPSPISLFSGKKLL